MSLRLPVALLALLLAGRLSANEMRIAATPILSASLAAGTTWQVQSFTNGGPWSATGVLVAGSATPVSVRLDGFPAAAAYRLLQTDGAMTVSPAVGRGLHLAGTAAGASQVTIDASADLSHWSQTGLAVPAAAGSYLRVVREPIAGRAFFRSALPATP